MSGEKKRYPRRAALEVAREMCRMLKPVTDRLVVAGSLRRMKDEVGDVEILYIPQFENRPLDMFTRKNFDIASELLDRLVAEGKLEMRMKANGQRTWGNMNKLAVHTATGIPVDFFRADENNWYNYLVCRTGSMETNKRIAEAAIAKRLKWMPYGAGFMDWGDNTIRVEKEEDVFSIVGLDYLEPKDR